MGDLIERLLDRGVCSIYHNSCRNDMVCEEAAAALEAKDAEIARLRDALKKIRDENQLQDENRYWEMRDGYYAQIARAALAEDDTPGEKEVE
jgi:hypothetical protein